MPSKVVQLDASEASQWKVDSFIGDVDSFIGDVDASGTSMTMIVPGLSHSDIDRNRNIGFHMLIRYFEAGRVNAMNNPNFLNRHGRRIWKAGLMFALVTEYEIRTELYYRVRKNNIRQQFAVKTIFKGVTKSSLIFQILLSDPKDGELLAGMHIKYIVVDPNTRKSIPVPQWFLEDYKEELEQLPKVTLAYKPKPVPKADHGSNEVFTMKYTMLPSDIDINRHVNNSAYFRLCLDAAGVVSEQAGGRNGRVVSEQAGGRNGRVVSEQAGGRNGRVVSEQAGGRNGRVVSEPAGGRNGSKDGFKAGFKGISGDLARYICTQATALYSKECSVGEEVVVHTWEDETKAGTLHFLVRKEKEDVLSFSGTMSFELFSFFTPKL